MKIQIPEDVNDLLKLARQHDIEFTPYTKISFIISRTCRKIYPVGEWWQQAELWTRSIFPEEVN